MNAQSIILLSFVIALFLFVGYRYVQRQKKGHNCGCGCDGCNGCQ